MSQPLHNVRSSSHNLYHYHYVHPLKCNKRIEHKLRRFGTLVLCTCTQSSFVFWCSAFRSSLRGKTYKRDELRIANMPIKIVPPLSVDQWVSVAEDTIQCIFSTSAAKLYPTHCAKSRNREGISSSEFGYRRYVFHRSKGVHSQDRHITCVRVPVNSERSRSWRLVQTSDQGEIQAVIVC